MTAAILNSPSPLRVAGSDGLTTHCIVVPAPRGDYCRALASLQHQSEPIGAITVIGDSAAAEISENGGPVRWIDANGDGQIAALNVALANIRSELVFFLRCDDTWTPDHLVRMRDVYAKQPEVDVVFCDAMEGATENNNCSETADSIDIGFSAVATYMGLEYVGGPLSCLSIRRRIVERIVPLVDDTDWNNQPEACLMLGASLAAARKCHLRLPLAQVTKQSDRGASDHEQRVQTDFAYRLKIVRLVGKIAKQVGLHPDFVKQFLEIEYRSRPKDRQIITKYCRLLQSYHPDSRSRRQILLSMYRDLKAHLHAHGSLRGRLRCWWLKQKLLWTGRLMA